LFNEPLPPPGRAIPGSNPPFAAPWHAGSIVNYRDRNGPLTTQTKTQTPTHIQTMNTLTACTPLRDFGTLPGRLSSLADALFGDTRTDLKVWSPAVNVSEDEHAYKIAAELPDVPANDVKVVVRDGVLSIKGERKHETKTEGVKYHLVERSYGSFQRSFSLPKDANGEKVAAEYKNGVLHITVPKREEVKPREIEVKVQ